MPLIELTVFRLGVAITAGLFAILFLLHWIAQNKKIVREMKAQEEE